MKKILNKPIFYNFKLHVFLILIIIFISTWGLFYYDYYQLAQSESGIFFYPSYTFEGNINSWGSYFMGYRNSTMLPYLTFLFRFMFSHDFKPVFISQFLYYFSLFSFGVLGLYKLIDYFSFTKKSPILKLYLSLLVIFNPAALSVLLRFQYPLITFYFILPLIFYLSIKVFTTIENRDFLKNIIFLNLLLSFYSIIYASMPSLVMVNILWVLLVLFYAFKNFKIQFLYKIFFFYIIWFFLNSFWLLPFLLEFTIPNNLYSSQFTLNASDNLSTLNYFSKRDSNLLNIFTLHTEEYSSNFFKNNLYLEIVFKFINILPVFVVIYFLFKYRKNISLVSFLKSKYLILCLLFLIFFIIVRGTNFPFETVYSYLFQKISIFQIFRNNFEKGMLFFYLTYIIIFSITIHHLLINNIRKKILLSILLIYFFANSGLILTSTLLLGSSHGFENLDKGFRLKIPDYYLELSESINKNHEFKNSNNLVLPIVTEGITYNWEYGYIGVDILHQIISNRSYSFTAADSYKDRVSILENIYYAKNKNSILEMFNFKSIIFRDDYDFTSRSQLNPYNAREYFLSDFKLNTNNLKKIDQYSLVVNSNKTSNFYNGNLYNSLRGSLIIDYDRENFIYSKLQIKDENLLPFDTPFVLIIQSPDIKKVEDFEIMNSKKQVRDKLIFSNSSICENCFVSEAIYNNNSQPITSISMKIIPKQRGTTLKIEGFLVGTFQSEEGKKLDLIEENKLFISNNVAKDIKCYSKFEIVNNISKFIFEDFDPKNIVYIKESNYPQILEKTKLDVCSLKYEKVTNSEYIIDISPSVSNTTFNSLLQFKNSADSLWILIPDGLEFWKALPFKYQSFISNSFSNTFVLIDIPSNGIRFKLVYLPNLIFEIFKYVSLSSWVAVVVIYIYARLKKF